MKKRIMKISVGGFIIILLWLIMAQSCMKFKISDNVEWCGAGGRVIEMNELKNGTVIIGVEFEEEKNLKVLKKI